MFGRWRGVFMLSLIL